MSYFLTEEVASKAVALVVDGLIEPMMQRDEVRRPHLHIVVLDPTITLAGGYTFEDAILYEWSIGPTGDWQHPYREIARKKAEQTWRTGLPSRVVQQLAPHLYVEEDTLFAGSVNHLGIIVACSGVEDYFDEGFAMAIAAMLWALVKQRDAKARAHDFDFLGRHVEPTISPQE